jgi:hypothetical protein
MIALICVCANVPEQQLVAGELHSSLSHENTGMAVSSSANIDKDGKTGSRGCRA